MAGANEKGKNVAELSAEELFRRALQKQADELGTDLKSVFLVTINHTNKENGHHNYVLEVLVTPNGDVLNIEHFKDYCILRNVRVSGGYLILNSMTDECSKIPLIEDYVTQIHHADVITTISVSKKKMKT